MQFYKIQGTIIPKETDINEKKSRKTEAHLIASKTSDFNSADTQKFCFICELDANYFSLGIIFEDPADPEAYAEEFVKFIGLDLDGIESAREITVGNIQNIINASYRYGFVGDEDEILERFGLNRICGRRRYDLSFGENMINRSVKKEDLMEQAEKLFACDTLIPEIGRIYQACKSSSIAGHPVHYIVETDNCDSRRMLYKIILDALYANHRLKNRRYSFLDFHPGEDYSRAAFEALYKISEGGAVIVRYTANDLSEDGSAITNEIATVEHICETVKQYRNKVLTVICFPRECKKIKSLFYKNLGNLSFVEIREDYVIGESARNYLRGLAKEKNIRADKNLFARIEGNSAFLTADLNDIFDEWYNVKLKTTVYPQYKDISVANKKVIKEKPRGSAYDELGEMIGLAEAKKVIQKALNYYKMQKVYKEMGASDDNLTMHMVFTGNPGTAKTTVARLFARIMKENGLLSRGQFIEVGRGDLVGKYVGWTANIVKDKFKEASGGVLFIDEAYSLVDDRNGSFGDEAINTIVQEMENHRADVVVIFAGYTDRMEEFLRKNPGLRSRIAFHVPFCDYDSNELCQIADLLGKKNGMQIEQAAIDKLCLAFDAARKESDFGNGRYVRNIFEQARMNQASRLVERDFDSIDPREFTTITADDIIIPENKRQEKRRIGFC